MPAGGALIIMKYSYLDVFRPGFLSNVWSLGRSDIVWLSYNNFIPMRVIEICDAAMDTPFNETLDLRNLTSQRPLG